MEEGRQFLSPEEIHELLFQMMCAFADSCDAHGIRYYLCGGTLLGGRTPGLTLTLVGKKNRIRT